MVERLDRYRAAKAGIYRVGSERPIFPPDVSRIAVRDCSSRGRRPDPDGTMPSCSHVARTERAWIETHSSRTRARWWCPPLRGTARLAA